MSLNKPIFLKPGESAGWEEDKSDIEALSGTRFIYNPNITLALEHQRQKLPVYHSRNHILHLLEEYQTLVLVGETGCGKSTQVPQYLLESGWCEEGKMVGVTEPRRISATTLAARVADETGSVLGQTVGYTIRFDNVCQDGVTKIKYMTEGILLREMMADPLLRQYAVIMLDEVHERTTNTDILMGLLKKVLRKQKKMRLIVTSATMDAEHLCNFFNHSSNKDKKSAVIMSVEGRLFPVKIHYLKEPAPDYVRATVDTVVKIHSLEPAGDVLCFLTGQEEVDRAVALLKEHAASTPHRDYLQPNFQLSICSVELVILPMYGSLPNGDQLKVFQHPLRTQRKIVMSTNIAETSVTIPGIVYVVDCGFVKMVWYNPKTCSDSLVTVPVSQASAEQRAGRAGRVRQGKVFRLYCEQDYSNLAKITPPEMQRTDLSGAVIQLKALGIDNVIRFPFPSPPPARHLVAAYELLHALGAIDDEGSLSQPLGTNMAELPLPPLHAKVLLASGDFDCTEEIASILSLLQVQNVFIQPAGGAACIKARVERRKFEVEEGDLLTLLNVYTAYKQVVACSDKSSRDWCHQHFVNHKAMKRVSEIRSQMLKLCEKISMPTMSAQGDSSKVRRCLTSGFFPNAAYLHHSGVYKTVRGDVTLHIHPTSVLYTLEQPQWLLFCEVVQKDKNYMRELTVIQPEWLEELASHFYHKTFDT